MSSGNASRIRASLVDRQVRLVEDAGARVASRSLAPLRAAIFRHVADGGREFDFIVGPMMEAVRLRLNESMAVAHMMAYAETVHRIRNRDASMRLRSRSIKSLAATAARAFANLTPEDVARLSSRYDARTLATIGQLTTRVVDELRTEVALAISDRLTTQAAIARVKSRLDGLGIGSSPFAIETQFRTHANMAYSVGQWQANSDPDIAEIVWGFEYVTAGDDRVRPNHSSLDGIRLPRDHALWNDVAPPNGFNCRCRIIEIFSGDVEASAVLPPKVVPETGEAVRADEGWRFNPGRSVAGGSLAVV